MNKLFNMIYKLKDMSSASNTVDIDSEMIKDFLSFYRQNAYEISRHLEYERDLTGSLKDNNSIILKFDVDSYASKLNKYFEAKKLYSAVLKREYFQLLVLILVPEKLIADLIPFDIRKKFFLRMIDSSVLKGRISRKIYIKNLWEYITSIENPVNGEYPEKILELFKECLADQTVKEEQKSKDETIDIFQKLDVLTEVLANNKIRSQREMRRLVRSSSLTIFFLKLLFHVIIAVALYIFLFYIKYLDNNSTLMFSSLIQISILAGIIWLLILVYSISSFSYAIARKKAIFRSILGTIKVLYIKPDVLKVFFKNKFSFDYRKIH